MPSTTRLLIRVELAAGIATITINRPELLNSINPAVTHQLHQAFEQVAADRSVQGIVISGEGKAFVAGADLGFFVRNLESGDLGRIVKAIEAVHRLYNAIDRCPKPVVARLNGVALGGGVELALACDRIVAARRGNLGFPETGLGIFPTGGGTQRLPRAIGVGLAKWLIFTGKTLTAADATRIGLIDRVVPEEELEAAARETALNMPPRAKPAALPAEFAAIARFFRENRAEALRTGSADTGGDPALQRIMRQVASKAPLALRFAETLIEQTTFTPLEEGLQMEIDHVREIYSTQDAYRGLSSRVRRQIGQPAFEGR